MLGFGPLSSAPLSTLSGKFVMYSARFRAGAWVTENSAVERFGATAAATGSAAAFAVLRASYALLTARTGAGATSAFLRTAGAPAPVYGGAWASSLGTTERAAATAALAGPALSLRAVKLIPYPASTYAGSRVAAVVLRTARSSLVARTGDTASSSGTAERRAHGAAAAGVATTEAHTAYHITLFDAHSGGRWYAKQWRTPYPARLRLTATLRHQVALTETLCARVTLSDGTLAKVAVADVLVEE